MIESRLPEGRSIETLQLFVCLSAVFGTIVVLSGHVAFGRFGWDFETYQTAVAIWEAGKNPYDQQMIEAFGHNYPFVYPPITLPFLAGFTIPTAVGLPVYFLEYAVVLALCGYLLSSVVPTRTPDLLRYAWLVSLLVTGFVGGYWVLLAGNFDLVILSFICLCLYFAETDRWYLSGLFLSLAGCIKILPFLAAGVYLVLDTDIRNKAVSMLGVVSGPVAVFGGSWVLFPGLFPTEFFESVSKEGGVTEIFGDGSVVSNPLLYLWQDIAGGLGVPAEVGVAFHVLFSITILLLGVDWIRRFDSPAPKLALGVLGAVLVFSRMKPYYLVYAVPGVFLITTYDADSRRYVTWTDIVLVLGLPSVSRAVYLALGRAGVRGLPLPLTLLTRYLPILCLLSWAIYRYRETDPGAISRKVQSLRGQPTHE